MALKNGRKREWEDEIVAGNNDDGFSGVLAQDLQVMHRKILKDWVPCPT